MRLLAMSRDSFISHLVNQGSDLNVARNLAELITNVPFRNQPEMIWKKIYRDYLTPDDDFRLHACLYEKCYGPNALSNSPGPAWFPTDDIINHANVTEVANQLQLAGYSALHEWSVRNREAYWELVLSRLNISLRKQYSRILDVKSSKYGRWLIDAQLNIVDSCFQTDETTPAVIESNRPGNLKITTYAELKCLTGRVANALAAGGIGRDTTVGLIAPLTAASVATYLGIIATGAAVVSIADSFSIEEIANRLKIVGARLIFTQDIVAWGSKQLDLYDKVAKSTCAPIVVMTADRNTSLLRECDHYWERFISIDDRLSTTACVPDDAINILFSSGTTGHPKAVPWSHTTPIKCAADAHFHQDLHAHDVVCWPTNLGWMMGPWLIFATLINHSTMALHLQSPHGRDFGEFIRDAGVTMLGTIPSLIQSWRQSQCMKSLNWNKIRTFSSTGECSNVTDTLYLMHLAGYRPVIEYCGGTELGGGYVTSTVVQPCIPAAFTTPALGIDFKVIPHKERELVGEAYLIGPSIGFSSRLVNYDHQAAYYDGAPADANRAPLRRHGDELEVLPKGGFRVVGRSDDSMNLGGIKVGCSEIERVVKRAPGVMDAAAIAVSPPNGGPSSLVIFAVLSPPGSLKSLMDLKTEMQRLIHGQLNPLFRIDRVEILSELPRTVSNKILRRELRSLIQTK